MAEERQKMLQTLKKLIKSGDFDYEFGDQYYDEDFEVYTVDDNPNLEEAIVTYRFENSWRGIYEVWGRGESGEGNETLGTILDFILNRKFGNKAVEAQWQEVVKYLEDTSKYKLSDAIATESYSWDEDDMGDYIGDDY